MRRRTHVALLMLVVSFAAHAKTLLLNVPLQWKPTSDLQVGTVQIPQALIQFESFQDVRTNRTAIGENDEDEMAKPVTTNGDVGVFVSDHMRELFEQAGMKTGRNNGAVIIKGEITRFFVRETNTYRSQVAVRLTVIGHDGKTRWSGLASGEATRFGRSYKLENYAQVLSDAVVNTASSMLMDVQFQAALSAP